MSDNESMVNVSTPDGADDAKLISRRKFITVVGGAGAAIAAVGGVAGSFFTESAAGIPASEGYLIVDTLKCAGCQSCVMACSMVHSGVSNPALSRIQIMNNVFAGFNEEDAIWQAQCRQCDNAACEAACPTGALFADPDNGNVRRIDPDKCIGCERCAAACPFSPSRVQWDSKLMASQKCDLCVNTPYMTEEGGPGGQQACAAVCPLDAIHFTSEMPEQEGDSGYMVNLRKDFPAWGLWGFPQGDHGEFTTKPTGGGGGH